MSNVSRRSVCQMVGCALVALASTSLPAAAVAPLPGMTLIWSDTSGDKQIWVNLDTIQIRTVGEVDPTEGWDILEASPVFMAAVRRDMARTREMIIRGEMWKNPETGEFVEAARAGPNFTRVRPGIDVSL